MNSSANDLQSATDRHTGRSDNGHGDWWIALAMVALIVAVVAGVAGVARGASGPDVNDGKAAKHSVTVTLAQLPPATAELYRYVANHADHFTQLPCYCGCVQSIGHRNLHDCFVNANGDWDAHASGCAVCTTEATTAQKQLDTDMPIKSVRALIIDRYGPQSAL